jgi:hypothetical protein
VRTLLVGLILILCTPAYAQQPPVIDFDSAPMRSSCRTISISVK